MGFIDLDETRNRGRAGRADNVCVAIHGRGNREDGRQVVPSVAFRIGVQIAEAMGWRPGQLVARREGEGLDLGLIQLVASTNGLGNALTESGKDGLLVRYAINTFRALSFAPEAPQVAAEFQRFGSTLTVRIPDSFLVAAPPADLLSGAHAQ